MLFTVVLRLIKGCFRVSLGSLWLIWGWFEVCLGLGYLGVLSKSCKHCKLRRTSWRHASKCDLALSCVSANMPWDAGNLNVLYARSLQKSGEQHSSSPAWNSVGKPGKPGKRQPRGTWARNVTGIFPDSVPLELDDPLAKVTTSFCQHRKLPLVIKPGNGQLPFTVIFPATNLHFCWGFPIGTFDSRWVLEVRLFLAAGFLKTELVSHNSPHSAQMGDTRETAPLLGKMMINWLTSACKELGLIRATQVSCF